MNADEARFKVIYVRHPMCTAFFLIGIGIVLLSANWVVGSAYPGAVLLM